MNEELAKTYIANNDIFGLPQQYKGIDFYPIKIKESKLLELFYLLMTIPKNFGQPKEIVKMSYIRYMIYACEDIQKMENDFVFFLSSISKKEVHLAIKQKDLSEEFSFNNSNIIISFGKTELTEWEFEELREIILEQNGLSIEFVNQYHPELEAKMNAIRSTNLLSFEDQIFTIMALRNKDPAEVGEYTIYQMQQLFDRMVTLKQFDLYQPLVTSGAITLKNGEVKSYLYHIGKRGRYDEIMIEKSKYLDKNKDIFGNPSK